MANDFKALIAKVATGASLTREEAAGAFDSMMSGEATPSQMGGLLMALRVRGETVDEITGAVSAMRGKMLRVQAPADAVDVVGTGGDGSGSVNVSTCAALIAAVWLGQLPPVSALPGIVVLLVGLAVVIRAGARGYVTKSISPPELADAIRRVHEGDAVFSPRLAGFVLDAYRSEQAGSELDELTPREREVLQLIARGYLYKEIAARLDISVKTVESHVSSVLRKLQLSNRHELTRWATSTNSASCASRAATGTARALSAPGHPRPSHCS